MRGASGSPQNLATLSYVHGWTLMDIDGPHPRGIGWNDAEEFQLDCHMIRCQLCRRHMACLPRVHRMAVKPARGCGEEQQQVLKNIFFSVGGLVGRASRSAAATDTACLPKYVCVCIHPSRCVGFVRRYLVCDTNTTTSGENATGPLPSRCPFLRV